LQNVAAGLVHGLGGDFDDVERAEHGHCLGQLVA
jgi:hypothetical protein